MLAVCTPLCGTHLSSVWATAMSSGYSCSEITIIFVSLANFITHPGLTFVSAHYLVGWKKGIRYRAVTYGEGINDPLTQKSILGECKSYQNTWCTSCSCIHSPVIRIIIFCQKRWGENTSYLYEKSKMFYISAFKLHGCCLCDNKLHR